MSEPHKLARELAVEFSKALQGTGFCLDPHYVVMDAMDKAMRKAGLLAPLTPSQVLADALAGTDDNLDYETRAKDALYDLAHNGWHLVKKEA